MKAKRGPLPALRANAHADEVAALQGFSADHMLRPCTGCRFTAFLGAWPAVGKKGRSLTNITPSLCNSMIGALLSTNDCLVCRHICLSSA